MFSIEGSDKLLVMGEINIHIKKLNDTEVQQFKDLQYSLGLKHFATDATHMKHCLDVVMTRAVEELPFRVSVCEKVFSDHFPLLVLLDTLKPYPCKEKGKYKKTERS